MEAGTERIAQLVTEMQNGNNKAFDELYKLTSSRAYFVALQITKNEQDAEDVLQESYVNAIAKINSLEKPESFVSWFHHIVANKSKDSLKKKKPTLFEGGEDEAFEVIPDEDTSFSPEDNLNQAELQKAVMEVIGELTEEKRACVLMMYFEEMSVNEIAEALEVPVSTVKNRLFTARKDLKAKFEKRGITCVYSAAPIGVIIWALSGMADAVSKTFTGSAASASVFAKITAASSATAATTAAAATATGGTAAASAAASAGTGVAAKVAALTVAQKVVAGVAITGIVTASAAGVATVVNNSVEEETTTSTTAYTEEITTLPTTVLTTAVMAIIESTTETTTEPETTVSTTKRTTTERTTEKTTESTTVKATVSTTAKTEPTATTSVPATTAAATKPKTTRKTTTRRDYSLYTSATTATTAAPTTTVEETTTRRQRTTTTTTEPETTKRTTATEPETEERTTKTTTTTTTTTKAAPATVVLKVYDMDDNVVDTITTTIEAGESISGEFLDNMANDAGYSPYGIYTEMGESHSVGVTAESGETYGFRAEL